MRRIALWFLLAGCASTGDDLKSLSSAELCYRGATRAEDRQAAADEIRRRNDDCSRHTAEVDRLRDEDIRSARQGTGGAPGMRQGGMGGMGRY